MICFNTQQGPDARSVTLEHPDGNRTRNLANLVQCSANRASKAVAERMVINSVFLDVVMPTK